MAERSRAEPVPPDQRVLLIDVLRGFALTGVLMVNMMSYGAYGDQWTGSVDRAFRLVDLFFVEHRFWHLFSLLFGLGFAIQWQRATERGAPFVPVYLRRLVFLFGFGAATNVLFRVDILTDYALLGVLLLPLRRWSARAVLVLALLTHLAPSFIGLGQEGLNRIRMRDVEYVEAVRTDVESGVDLELAWQEEERALRTNGAFLEVVAGHARRYVVELKQPDLQPSFGQWWGYLSLFILGLFLGKLRVFAEYRKHRPLARKVAAIGLSMGVVAMTIAAWDPPSRSALTTSALEALNALGLTGFMLFYVYLVSEWSLTTRWRWLQSGFAAVGRTALSNYLLQAFLINLIFMGWGFGLYDRLGPAMTMVLSSPIFGLLMILSVWWIARFRYGPAEWLWRTLTYGAMQPMRD